MTIENIVLVRSLQQPLHWYDCDSLCTGMMLLIYDKLFCCCVGCYVKSHFSENYVLSRTSKLAIPRHTELNGKSTFFRGITKNIQGLFCGIFSERSLYSNPSSETHVCTCPKLTTLHFAISFATYCSKLCRKHFGNVVTILCNHKNPRVIIKSSYNTALNFKHVVQGQLFYM